MSEIRSVTLLLGSRKLPTYMVEALRRMEAETSASVDLIVIASSPERSRKSAKDRGVLVLKKALKPIFGTTQVWEPIEQLPFLADVEVIESPLDTDYEFGVGIPPEMVERIASETDIVVHFGVGILKGDILREPEFGVIGFHHGDLYEHRGAHAGFWEFIRNEPVSGVTLQQYTEQLDAGRIICLEHVDIRDAGSWGEVRNRLYRASEPMLAKAVQLLNDSTYVPRKVPSEELGEMHYRSDRTWRELLEWLLVELRSRL